MKPLSLLIVLFLAAYAHRSLPTREAMPEAQRLGPESLRNLEYRSEWTRSGRARLVDGEYRERAAPGSATETIVRLAGPIARGRIDREEVAVVVLVVNPGGSGTFVYLAVVKEVERWPENVATLRLGDRVRVGSLAISDGAIVADVVERGPADPYCCPSHEARRRFVLAGSELREVGGTGAETARGAPPEAAKPIMGVSWRWQRTVRNDDTESVPGDPSRYTLELRADGRAKVRADCNAAEGSHTINGKGIAIRIERTTLAACPPGSLADRFLRDLGRAAIWFVRGGELYLDLWADAGTMRFSRPQE